MPAKDRGAITLKSVRVAADHEATQMVDHGARGVCRFSSRGCSGCRAARISAAAGPCRSNRAQPSVCSVTEAVSPNTSFTIRSDILMAGERGLDASIVRGLSRTPCSRPCGTNDRGRAGRRRTASSPRSGRLSLARAAGDRGQRQVGHFSMIVIAPMRSVLRHRPAKRRIGLQDHARRRSPSGSTKWALTTSTSVSVSWTGLTARMILALSRRRRS